MPSKPKWEDTVEVSRPSWDDTTPDYEAEATLAADKKYEETKPSALEAAMYGVAQGGSRNFADDIAGLIGGDAAKEALRNRVKRSKDDQSAAYTAGEIGSKIATLPATLNPFGAAGIAAADTAVSGVGDDKAAKDIAVESGISGLSAGVLTAVLPKLSQAAREKLAPLLQRQADESTIKALGGTQKQVQDLGDKMPDVANLVRDRKVITPFTSSKQIAENAADLGDDLAQQTRPIYSQSVDSRMPREELLSKVNEEIASLRPNPGNAPIIKKLKAYKDAIYDSRQSSFNPTDLKHFRQAVDKTINFNSDAPSQLASKNMRSILREAEMGQIEKVAPALRQANEGLFRDLHLTSLAEDMAEKGAARSANNNAAGLNTYQAGGIAAELSKSNLITAMAMASREAVRRFGPQMAGIGLDKAAKALSGTRYEPMFLEAAKQGPAAIIALHTSLKRNNPEYAAMVGE